MAKQNNTHVSPPIDLSMTLGLKKRRWKEGNIESLVDGDTKVAVKAIASKSELKTLEDKHAADINSVQSSLGQLGQKIDTVSNSLGDKADVKHTHGTEDVNGLTTALADKIDTTDYRLTDARVPLSHVSTHRTGGGDALSASDIGAVATPTTPGKKYLVTSSGLEEFIPQEPGSEGTLDHNDLINRDAPDQHPQSSISGLEATLNGKAGVKHASGHASGGDDVLSPGAIGAMIESPSDGKTYLACGAAWIEHTESEVSEGTFDHTKLENRDVPNQHPMVAVAGLGDALNAKADAQAMTAALALKAQKEHGHKSEDIDGLIASLSLKVNVDDERLSNSRQPTTHAFTHSPVGSDPISGYATLNGNGNVPVEQLPTGSSTQRGILRVDGETIIVKDGVISATPQGSVGGGEIKEWDDNEVCGPPLLRFGSDNNVYKAVDESGPGTAVGPRNPINEPIFEESIPSPWFNVREITTEEGIVEVIIFKDILIAVPNSSNFILRSVNFGSSWTKVTTPSKTITATHCRSAITDSSILIPCGATTGGVLKSDDGGLSWVVRSTSGRLESLACSGGKVMGVGGRSCFISNDGGDSWVKGADIPLGSSGYVGATSGVFVVPSTSNSNQVSRTDDFGQSWELINLSRTAYWHNCTGTDGRFLVLPQQSGRYGFFSSDAGKTFKETDLLIGAGWPGCIVHKNVVIAVSTYMYNIVSYDFGETFVLNGVSGELKPQKLSNYKNSIVGLDISSKTIGMTSVSLEPVMLPNCWKLIG